MLKAVEIQNFRSCIATNFKFGGGLCAISGRNGVGKSNILKAIEWACSTVITVEGVKRLPAGNITPNLDEISIRFQLELDGLIYHYCFQVPALNRLRGNMRTLPPGRGLGESLDFGEGELTSNIFQRQDESVQVGDGRAQLRIPNTTPALAALFSLLGSDDPVREHVTRLTSFFGAIGYYGLEDRSDPLDHVTEGAYNEWRFRYQSAGDLTGSVAMRLVYMWQEEPDLFGELLAILGADGLDVIDQIDVVPMGRHEIAGAAKDGAAASAKLFMPLFVPAGHMGGAGEFFPFSQLSDGTRRVVRVIASMLFDKRSLMLMEHPEDSIHPGLLRKLIDQLRTYSSMSQMLFTSHSLEVLDIMSPEEILLATAPGGSTIVRALTSEEVAMAKLFLQEEGSLSDFLEPLDAV